MFAFSKRAAVFARASLLLGAALPLVLPAAAEDASPASSGPAAAASATVTPAVNPVIGAARTRLKDKALSASAETADVAAVSAYYGERAEPYWVKDGAYTPKAAALIAELKKAGEWGLEAGAFSVPDLASAATPEMQGEAEARLMLAAVKYVRHARGGRIDPQALSALLDMQPPLKDPKAVIAELTASDTPDAVLRDAHPKHEGFKTLRAALLKALGPQEAPKVDEALAVKLPGSDKTLKAGAEYDDVALLRKRLKVPAEAGASDRLFDSKVEAALKDFQKANGLKATGQLTPKTRSALNTEGEDAKPDPKREVERILVNMERWRWLPDDLGSFYVMNNVPEFTSRTVKNGSPVLTQKLIAGQPTWPTPMLMARMQIVVFNPQWGVPDGIKVKELLPRLKRASQQQGGTNFFEQLFGGGSGYSGGGGRVLAAYKLQPTLDGKPVDANSIDWNRVDIRRFTFVQPAGAENPLGVVKFMFPNKHDVYMHDTPQKALFGRASRALSHGCMRLEQPRKLAEIVLAEDKGWSTDKVSAQYATMTNEVRLEKSIPVYVTYFTASADETGKVTAFPDVYGHDSRLTQALAGRVVRYGPDNSRPDDGGDDAVSDATVVEPQTKQAASKKVPAKTASAGKRRSQEPQSVGEIMSDALSGLLAN